ncbi:MAG: alanine racemase [Planctomycetes bacterium]|nr:alanine racemase [Planctomycetota bacterium]
MAVESQVETPALVISLDLVRANLMAMRHALGGDLDRWRPHLKTAKIPEIFAEYLDLGLRAFKCATPREARVLFEVAEELRLPDLDLLVAYPHRGPALSRLAALAGRNARWRLSVLVEDADDVSQIPDALGLFVDLDPGEHRSGRDPRDHDGLRACVQAAGTRFRGLHFYEGLPPGETAGQRRAAAIAGYDRLLEAAAGLARSGLRGEELVTSGTPAFPYALDHPPFRTLPMGARHRVSPGTVVYSDLRTEEERPELDLSFAAVVVSRVISRPEPGRFTCDAGSKALAAEVAPPVVAVVGHPEFRAQTPSEEHLPFTCPVGSEPDRGAILRLVPRHVCPTVNLAERAILVGADFDPRIVEVRARAHDLEFMG